MNYLKFTQYVYLAAALFFIYEGASRFEEPGSWIWFAIAVLAIFMFFFRRKYAQKFEQHKRDRDNQPK